MLSKQKESIMLEIKTMNRASPQNSAESETFTKCHCNDSSEESESTENTFQSKDEEITCLKNYISQYEQKNAENDKTLQSLRRKFKKEYEENLSEISVLKTQLVTSNSRIEDLHHQRTALRQENKQLKDAVAEFENQKSKSEDSDKSNSKVQDLDGIASDIEDNGESDQDSLIEENKQIEEKMKSSDDSNKKLENSDFNDTQNSDNEENVIVKTANTFENNEQNTHEEILEHENHDESDDHDYDYDHDDHYENYEYEECNEYMEYEDYNEYDEYSHDDFVENDILAGSNENYESYNAEKFYENEAELEGGVLDDDGIVICTIWDLLKLKEKGHIDIYKVIVTNKEGEKKKLNEIIMSLNEDQKALVKQIMEDYGTNIFEALSSLDIIEYNDPLTCIEHDSSIKHLNVSLEKHL